MSLPSCTNEETEEELKSWHDWIGNRVSISGTKVGILRYFGKTHFAEGSWCGVELDEPVGKNNGTVKDVRYFTCKANFGIFAPLSKTEKLIDESHKTTVPISHKSKLPQSKNRLKFIPLQNEIPKSLNETICLHSAKSNLPYYQSNANEPNTNTVNEIYEKHRKSEDFLEKREPNQFNNNTRSFLELGHLKIAERRTSTPVINPFRKHSTEGMADFLNKTITLDCNRRNSYSHQESLLQNNSLLNATFDLANSPVLDNAITDKKERTFILQNANMFSTDFNKRLSDGSVDYEEDPKSSDLEESLGILSPSQMKDFTLSFENNVGTAFQISPKIRKIESCDDVNEIPEFEDNRTYQELPGGTCGTLINFDPQKPLKHNSNVQIFDPLNDIGTPKKNTDVGTLKKNTNIGTPKKNTDVGTPKMNTQISQQGGNTEIVTEHPNMQPITNITPNALNKVRDNFSFLEFHPVEDVNLNALPSATSTPTLTLKLSKLPSGKPIKHNFIFSDVNSSSIEQKNFSSTLNQTFNHSSENNSPTSKVNMISKLLNDLDQTEEISGTKMNISKLDNSKWELFVASQDILGDINKKSISSDDKEPHIIASRLNNGDSLEEKVISIYPGIDTSSLLNHIFDTDETVNMASNMFSQPDKSEDSSECDKLRGINVEGSNHIRNACQNAINLLPVTLCNNDDGLDAMTVNFENKTQFDLDAMTVNFENKTQFDLDVVLNTEDKNENLVNAKTYTMLSQIPTDMHSQHKNEEIGNSEYCQVDEAKYGAIGNSSVFIQNENACFGVVQEEKSDLKREIDSTNRLSETFSCSTLNEIDELENQGTLLNNDCINKYSSDISVKSQVITLSSNSSSPTLNGNQDLQHMKEENYPEETHVLDVTMTVMKMDNLNMTVNIDTNQINCQPEQTSNVIYDGDSVQSKQSPILQNSLRIESQFSNDIKKSNDAKSLPSKQPKKNVISKIKLMLENDKNSCSVNQENQKSKHNVTNPRKMGKWDTVTSKIAAGLADSKKKVKKEITSRVNTNLNSSRQTMPKVLQPESITKYPSKPNINRKSEAGNRAVVSNNPKNSLNNQAVCEESKSMCCANKVNVDKDLRVLAQLQNVDCDNKQSKDLKANQKKKRMGLFSKTNDVLSRSNSLSSSCSQTSFAPPRIALQPKNSTPVKTKKINEKNDCAASKINIGSNEKPVLGKSRIGKILPRRNNTLPKVKQY